MNPLAEALSAAGPHSSLGAHAETCGRVIGSWIGEVRIDLEGRRIGDDIVQLGTRGGRPIRWTFSAIRADSFVWQGHILETDGATWRLEIEVRLSRARPG